MPYTDKQKREAVELYLKHGTTKAAKQSGISYRSILRWAAASGIVSQDRAKTEAAREELARRNSERREKIKDQLLDKMNDLLERMDAPHVDFKGKDAGMVTYPIATSGDVKNYAVSFAVLLDKYRLEMGEVTGRVETVGVDRAVQVVEDEIAKMRARHAAQ